MHAKYANVIPENVLRLGRNQAAGRRLAACSAQRRLAEAVREELRRNRLSPLRPRPRRGWYLNSRDLKTPRTALRIRDTLLSNVIHELTRCFIRTTDASTSPRSSCRGRSRMSCTWPAAAPPSSTSQTPLMSTTLTSNIRRNFSPNRCASFVTPVFFSVST